MQMLGRIGNGHQQERRPCNPADLQFELHTPAQFTVADISVGEQCHLLLFTDRQLQLLSRAHTWYVDGTFHIVRRPFIQLRSIHTFVRSYIMNFLYDGISWPVAVSSRSLMRSILSGVMS